MLPSFLVKISNISNIEQGYVDGIVLISGKIGARKGVHFDSDFRLPVFSEKFRSLIFEVRSQIQILNEEIDNAQFYFRKTFDSSMSSKNHEIVRLNITSCYKNIARQAKPIVEKINDLILYKSKDNGVRH